MIHLADLGATGSPGFDATGILHAALALSREVVVTPGIHCVTHLNAPAGSFVLRGYGEDSQIVIMEPAPSSGRVASVTVNGPRRARISDLTVQFGVVPTSGYALSVDGHNGLILDNVRLAGYLNGVVIGGAAGGQRVAFRGFKADPGPDGGTSLDIYHCNALYLDAESEVSARANGTGIRFGGTAVCDTVSIAALVKDAGTAIRAIGPVANVDLSGARLDGVQNVALHLEPGVGAALSSWHALGGLWVSSAGYGVIADASKGSISEIDLRFAKLDSAASLDGDGRPVNMARPLLSLKGLTNSSFAGRYNPSACAPGVQPIAVSGGVAVDVSGMRAVA